ncbi:hypothetical protein [Citrobacter europaeus]|uniref:hypothetical protein n=1 Tax=Citrobacter europaeus TaxID=1914243 RepID=UPI003978E9C9
MNEPRCIAQLLRSESPRPMPFKITHGKGRKGIIIRPRKNGRLFDFLQSLRAKKCL